jgi:perosamine synthetase
MTSTISKTTKGSRPIPLSEPVICGNEWKYVKDCLDSGWVSYLGAYVEKFERAFTDYLGGGRCAAVANGTAALHLSLIGCGVLPNDEVIVPTLTFVASVNVVKYCFAHPVFMDCDNDTLCIDTQKTADFISKECELRKDGYSYNKKTNRRIKAIIPVHVFGHPVDMEPLCELCGRNNIDIIEDAAESIGSKYKGKNTGLLGTIGCFSFNGNKLITAGGGGMVISKDNRLAEHVKHLSTQAKCDKFEYDHDYIGYNYRLSNVQAAIGLAQMERLKEFISIKRKNAILYKKLLAPVEQVEFIWEKPWAESNFWFYTIKIPHKHKKPLIDFLLAKQIQVRPIWKLIHTLGMYKNSQSYRIEAAPKAYESCINLPCSVSLTEQDIEYVAEEITGYFKKQ